MRVRRGFILGLLLSLGCATAGGPAGAASPPVEPVTAHHGPFVSERLGIADRTPTGFTAEAQLVVDNPGPGTMRIHSGDYAVTLGGDTVAKGDVILEQTAEVGERQGVVISAKVNLADGLGSKKVTVRMRGALHASQGGGRDLPFDVSLEVAGDSLLRP